MLLKKVDDKKEENFEDLIKVIKFFSYGII